MEESNAAFSKLDQNIEAYERHACKEIDHASLSRRNPKAHKWKVTFRTIVLRELVYWRTVDLLKQIIMLEKAKLYIGSRIITRSAIETLVILIYCVQKMQNIVSTGQAFNDFNRNTERLLLGMRDSDSDFKSINILTVLDVASDKYPKLKELYNLLSETAHPNFDGLCSAYSEGSEEKRNFVFTNQATLKFKDSQLSIIHSLLEIVDREYNQDWPTAFENFEKWLEINSDNLSATLQT